MSDKKNQTDAPAEVSEEDLDDAQGGAMRMTSTTQKVQKVSPSDDNAAEETKFRSHMAIP